MEVIVALICQFFSHKTFSYLVKGVKTMQIPFIYRSSKYRIDDETGEIYHRRDDGQFVKSSSASAPSFQQKHPKDDWLYRISLRDHDIVADTTTNLLGVTKFVNFDPRFNMIKVKPGSTPLIQRLELVQSEQPLLSPIARQLLINKYESSSSDKAAITLPRPFQNFKVYRDNTVIGVFVKFTKSTYNYAGRKFNHFVSRKYLVYYAGAANQPENRGTTGWQWLAYSDPDTDTEYQLPMSRQMLSHLYRDLQNGGTAFKRYVKTWCRPADEWSGDDKRKFFKIKRKQSAQHKVANNQKLVQATCYSDDVTPTADCHQLPVDNTPYYLDDLGNLFHKNQDGTFTYRKHEARDKSKDHWGIAVPKLIETDDQGSTLSVYTSRDIIAGLLSDKFDLALAPYVHPVIEEGRGSVFNRIRLEAPGCLDDPLIAYLYVQAAINDTNQRIDAASTDRQKYFEQPIQFDDGAQHFVIFRNNLVAEFQSKKYRIISVPHVSRSQVRLSWYRQLPSLNPRNSVSVELPLHDLVWDQAGSLDSQEYFIMGQDAEYSDHAIISTLSYLNAITYGLIPDDEHTSHFGDFAKGENQRQLANARLYLKPVNAEYYQRIAEQLDYLMQLNLTMDGYLDKFHGRDLAVDAQVAKDNPQFVKKMQAALQTKKQSYASARADQHTNSDNDDHTSDDKADDVINMGTNDFRVKSLTDLAAKGKFRLKKKAVKSFTLSNEQLSTILAAADDADNDRQFDYRLKLQLRNQRIKMSIDITKDDARNLGLDRIIKM